MASFHLPLLAGGNDSVPKQPFGATAGQPITLYTLTNGGSAVACTGQCATFWPPLVLPDDMTTAVAGAGVTGLGTASTAAGSQVTENGVPLYRFSMDKAPGSFSTAR